MKTLNRNGRIVTAVTELMVNSMKDMVDELIAALDSSFAMATT